MLVGQVRISCGFPLGFALISSSLLGLPLLFTLPGQMTTAGYNNVNKHVAYMCENQYVTVTVVITAHDSEKQRNINDASRLCHVMMS